MLTDHHCHLDVKQFDDDRAGVIARAEAAGVGVLVTICTRVRQFDRVRRIAEAHEHVFCSVGTHPHNADEETDVTPEELVALAEHPKVVAIGEAGLDYYYDYGSPEAQAEGFRRHIAAARMTGLPLEIHARDADTDALAILEHAHETGGPFPAILHCFTGGATLAKRAVDLGLHVSFSGIVTFKTGADLKALAAELPLDRVLVETDAPFLAPIPYRGKTNEPGYVRHTAQAIADARGMTFEAFAEATTDNVRRLFSKIPNVAFDAARARVATAIAEGTSAV
ncbi:MAG: TatD family hydrolase [Pseudomonadota bacterium]